MGVGLIERYRDRLALAPGRRSSRSARARRRSSTLPRLSARLGIELWLKWEGANPTGSFKDRGMTRRGLAGARGGRRRGDLRVDREHGRLGRRLRGAGRPAGDRARAGGRGRARQARPGARGRARRCSRCAAASTRRSPRRASSATRGDPRPRQLGQPVSGSRARRRRRSRSSRSSAARRTCSRSRTAAAATRARTSRASRSSARLPRSCRASRPSERTTLASRDPHRRARARRRGRRGARARRTGRSLTVTDEQIVAAWQRARARGGHLLRAVLRRAGSPGCAPPGSRPGRRSSASITGHGLKDTEAVDAHRAAAGHRRRRPGRDRRGRAVTIRGPGARRRPPTSGPASTAPPSRSTSGTSSRSERGRRARRATTSAIRGLRAARARPTGCAFTFTSRIPRERGLGSSASVIALGLVAGARAAGASRTPRSCSRWASPLEGHADNLAAALAGGVVPDLGRRGSRGSPTTCRLRRSRSCRAAGRTPTASRALAAGDRPARRRGVHRRPRRAARRRARVRLGRALRRRARRPAARAVPLRRSSRTCARACPRARSVRRSPAPARR